MRIVSVGEARWSKRQRSTPEAFSEKTAKFTPSGWTVAPRGYCFPCQTFKVVMRNQFDQMVVGGLVNSYVPAPPEIGRGPDPSTSRVDGDPRPPAHFFF